MDNFEQTIEYHELLMTLDNFYHLKNYPLPNEYNFVFYSSESDTEDWINIHISSGEFANRQEAEECFYQFHTPFIQELSKRCFFIIDKTGKKIASSTISTCDEFGYNCKIDWFAISKDGQGKHLAKPLLYKTIQIAKNLGYNKILLHTQTTTWLAAKIYLDFGFNPFVLKDIKGWQILKTIINHKKLADFQSLPVTEIYDQRIISIKHQLDKIYKNYSYTVWYENGRNDVYVHNFENDQELSYKFLNNGKKLQLIDQNKINLQIAGITNKDDAIMCANAGFNIIGLLVGQKHESNEFISKELAKQIKDSLPKNTKTTLITHLEDAKEIIEIAKFIDVDFIQLHSYIKESEVEKIKIALPDKKLIRLIHIAEDGTILNDIKKMKYVDIYFTDSINKNTNQVGGTGLTHNLETDKQLIQTISKPVMIAGGLTPENVSAAVKYCKPWGVDVNSGCRGENGKRNPQKVKAFVKNARK